MTNTKIHIICTFLGLLSSFLTLGLEGLAVVVEELLLPLTLISEIVTSPPTSSVPRSLPSGAIVVISTGTVFVEIAAC